jgi:hypothetical protein
MNECRKLTNMSNHGNVADEEPEEGEGVNKKEGEIR